MVLGLVTLCLASLCVVGQVGPLQGGTLNQVEIDQIVKKFTENENEFRKALTDYVFNRNVTIQTIGLGGLITGTYRRDSFMTFKKDGKRFERILFHPVSTVKGIQISPEDIEDLGGVNPFAINPKDVPLYTFSYLGKQRIDELTLHVFDVRPKKIPNPKKSKKRLFLGRIWVDDEDLMIVKSKGKGVPETKNSKYPVIETWRQPVDGKYWFPFYSYALDDLVFASGNVVKLKVKVDYNGYKRGRSEVIILDDDDPTPVEEPEKKPSEPEKPIDPMD